MADLEAHAARAHTPASNPRKEPREGVVEVPGHKPRRKDYTGSQPLPAASISKLRPATKASCGPPPVEKGVDVLVAQGAIYDV
jgi:hypothetical protein